MLLDELQELARKDMLEMIERLLLEADLESQIPKVLYVCRAIYRGATGKILRWGRRYIYNRKDDSAKVRNARGAPPHPFAPKVI